MTNTNVLLSDLKVAITHKFDFMIDFCEKYIANFDVPDICAQALETAVLKEKEMVPTAPIEVCESLCIYRAIAEQLPQFNRFVFHGAAIEYGGEAYLFTAPSGTGKTTHINLWRQHLGDAVGIINGDKPIINVTDKPIVYGTPWAGKEGLHRNVSSVLRAICILKQGKTNNIVLLNTKDAINHLMRQVYLPQNAIALSKTLQLLGDMLEQTPVYLLECDMSKQAFEVSFNKMTQN